jgi:hypothetical protein
MNNQPKRGLAVHPTVRISRNKWVDPGADIFANENSIFQNEKETKISAVADDPEAVVFCLFVFKCMVKDPGLESHRIRMIEERSFCRGIF